MAGVDKDTTSGVELNSYTGNAALATGDGTGQLGYAKIDLSPLDNYALRKFQVHQLDYQQQQADKKELEASFYDPKAYVDLEEPYANQLTDKLNRFKDLAKMQLQNNPNSKEFYEAKSLHNEIVTDNAKLKAVQTMKQKALDDAGSSADPHEKERLTQYADQLGKYKIGEEIPSYNKYFAYDPKHIPDGVTLKGTVQEVDANGNIVTKKASVISANGLADKTSNMLVTDPTAAQTYGDIAHTFLETGNPQDINASNKDMLNKNFALNTAPLQAKYKDEFTAFQKKNPNANFTQFLVATGKTDDYQAAVAPIAFLKNRVDVYKDGDTVVDGVPKPLDDGKTLAGYTYYTDPKTGVRSRASVDDATLAAMYGASKQVPGEKDEIIKSEVGITPKEKFEADNKLKLERENRASAERINANTQAHEDARAKYPYIYSKPGKTNDDTANADSVLQEVSSILNTGAAKQDKVYSLFFSKGKGSDSPYEISDPTILKSFTGLSKNGKNTDAPSKVEYDKQNDELVLTYHRIDKNEKGKDVATNETQRLNGQSYLTMKVKQKFPNKDIGDINNIVSAIYKKEGSLANISKLYDKDASSSAAPAATGNEQTRVAANGKTYKSTDGVTWKSDDGETVVLKSKK